MSKNVKNNFFQRHTLSSSQFSLTDLQLLFKTADQIKKKIAKSGALSILKGKLVTLLFFEPSSRTFSSFAGATLRLGGMTIDHQNPMQTSSAVKGETLADTVRVFENYSDAIVMRHFENGAADAASKALTRIPLINAGDGSGEHPTQALLDLYTISKHTKLDGLTILLVGDLLYGRTVHSLIKALSLYRNVHAYTLSPSSLSLPEEIVFYGKTRGVTFTTLKSQKDIPLDLDIWYWTRVQKERFKKKSEYEKLKLAFVLSKKLIDEKAGKRTFFMHPLPRVGEIEEVVDKDKRALYLTEQVANGMFVRMALLALTLVKNPKI